MFEDEDFDLDEDYLPVNFPNNAKPSVNIQDESSEVAKNKSSKIVLKRKFPGPAGLFPETTQIKNNSNAEFAENDSLITSTQLLCSQNPSLTFQKPAWLEMRKDFNTGDRSSVIDKYNVEWINSNVLDSLLEKKVPFLMAIITEVKNTSKSPIFLLADLSGEIEALISMELYEEYDEYLCVDSAIVLKKFSILTVGNSKHYINITSDNLIRIYSCKDSTEDDVKIVHIQETSNADLEKEIDVFVSENELKGAVASDFSNKSDGLSKNNKGGMQSAISIGQIKFSIDSKAPTNKFNFKKHLLHRNNSNTDKPSHSITSKRIFDQLDNTVDLDLNTAGFEDEFLLPRDSDKCVLPSYSEGKNERNVNKIDNRIETLGNKRKYDEVDAYEGNRNSLRSETRIDCSQVTIISQNEEDPDVLKEVLSDLDVSALFDDF